MIHKHADNISFFLLLVCQALRRIHSLSSFYHVDAHATLSPATLCVNSVSESVTLLVINRQALVVRSISHEALIQ